MAIHVPGKRNRRGKASPTARKVVAALSLTAMVDMFTVLVVFLLQNYNVTGEVITIPDEVILPNAKQVKELTPSNVIVVSEKQVLLNNLPVYEYAQVKSQEDWMLEDLRSRVIEIIKAGDKEKKKLGSQIVAAVQKKDEDAIDPYRKMTIQADKEIDFLTVKKVMYTVTEAGVEEINFAVIKNNESTEKQ